MNENDWEYEVEEYLDSLYEDDLSSYGFESDYNPLSEI